MRAAMLGLCALLASPPEAPDDVVVGRLFAICDSATRLSSGGESFGAFPVARIDAYDYLIAGVPEDLPPGALLAVDGSPVEILGRVGPLAVARVDRGTAPLLDVVPSTYAETMTLPPHLSADCVDLGTRASETLTPEDESLAALCEYAMMYRGPPLAFTCPGSWAFLHMVHVAHANVDGRLVPKYYGGLTLSGPVSPGRWADIIGMPVFDPSQADNVALGFVTGAEQGGSGQWYVSVAPLENVMGDVEDIMRRDIDSQKGFKSNP